MILFFFSILLKYKHLNGGCHYLFFLKTNLLKITLHIEEQVK